jgi:phosphate transport system substrate-binding protein
MRRSVLGFVGTLVAVLLLGASCGPGAGQAGEGGSLSGSVNVDGSSTVFPITQAVAEEFNAVQPDVQISVGVSGTGGGFEKFCRGETDISNASRPIDPAEEAPVCQENGIEYLELQVAIDGLSVVANPQNAFVDCLTVEELEAIWEPGSAVDNWSEVRPGFPDEPLALYGPGTDSGTFDYFTDAIVGEEGASRSDYTASEDDNVLVQGVAGDVNALGYFGFAYFEQNQDKLTAVAVDGGSGCVEPNRESILSGEYQPLSRPIFIYVSREAASRAEVSAFVDFYLESMQDLVPTVGYVALPEDVLAEQGSAWEQFKA